MTERVPRNPFRFLARHWGWVTSGIVCLVLTNAIAQSVPWIVRRAIDQIDRLAQHGGASWTVTRLVLLVVGLVVAQALIRILSRIFIFNAGREAEYELRGALFDHFCAMDGAFYRKFRTGDLMSRLTNDLSSVRALFGAGVLYATNTLFAYAIALPLMLRIDPVLTFWALVPYPLLLIGARYFARGMYTRSRDLQQSLSTMTSSVQEDLAGIRELKSYSLEQRRSALFADKSRAYLSFAVRLAAWRAGMLPFVGAGAGASMVLVLWIGGRRVIAGDLTLGDLVAFNLYIGLLAWPTMAIGWMVSMWQRGLAAWHRLRELLDERSPLAERGGLPEAEPGAGLRAEGLTLAIGERAVLQQVSFEIAPNTLCAVVGRVGSGKTTLAEAVARLLPVPDGTLFFGKHDVNALSVQSVRRQIAYAPQDAFLFSMSLRDNVAFGLPDTLTPAECQARIDEAVEAAGLTPDLAQLPRGLDTVVGERGVSLSGGQRQRVALARALASKRPLLILDDSLSSVDAETERLILRGLRGVLSGTTALMISHRLSALQHADQVLVLEEGRVIEAGSHEALLASDGVYSQLYRRQLLDHQLAQPDPAPASTAAPP